jgi:hypothetical protein
MALEYFKGKIVLSGGSMVLWNFLLAGSFGVKE